MAALVFTIACATYLPTLGGEFVWDDGNQIVRNPMLHDLGALPRLFRSSVWGFVGDEASYYRPVFMSSLAVDWSVWGGNPHGFHASNVLLHGFASMAAFALAGGLTADAGVALTCALLFALHPVQAEPAAWISGRTDLLVGLFGLMALALHARYRGTGRGLALGLSLAATALALLSKEMAVTLPLLVLLQDVCFGETRWRRRLSAVAAHGALVAGYLVVRWMVVGGLGDEAVPLSTRIATSFGIVLRYLGMLTAPVGLKVYYDWAEVPIRHQWMATGVLGPAAALLVVTGTALAGCILPIGMRRARVPAFGVLFVLLALLPVAGIVRMARPAPLATRYLYLPSFGACLVLGWVLVAAGRWASGRLGLHRATALAPALAVSLLFLPLTVRQSALYHDDRTFVGRMARDAPESPDSQNAVGVLRFREGRYAEAERAFMHALAITKLNGDVHYNLGLVYRKLGRPDQAERRFRGALACRPEFPEALLHLGQVLLERGDRAGGLASLRRAVDLRPFDPQFQAALAAGLAGGQR